ncbi:Retrovirus-related Pol polyprotein like [Argiope bruennichi]|uniref:Retrovirus-related Pol polyprotein like n=1 Tax=Argiope bruennichi TaxID=94029 RepID=A0A8T0ELJ9_ARGBR|nr:Retrovirus-related Pol polyprotein like [Argiope bruennichi]
MDLKVQIDKLEGAENWSKWKWQMKMHFEQYDLTSIIDGTKICPVAVNGDVSADEHLKKVAEWRRDNAKAAALIASTLSASVADLVMTYSNAKDIWDKLISVFEQSSIQRLNLLMTQFFQVGRDPNDNVATHAAKVERIYTDMNEFQEFSNVWESLGSDKRTTKNLVEKLCTIEQCVKSNAAVDYGAFAARVPGFKQKPVKNGERLPESTPVGAFAASANSTHPDVWVCDSGASHHMTANKQYFTSYKHFPVPIEVSLADNNKTYAYGSGRINIEVCIQGKWYDAHMENVWYVPDVKRHLFSVQQATKHGVEVKMTKRYAEFFRNEELVAVGSWRDGTYIMSMRVVIPASPAEISIATETESLQLWHESLGQQNKRHVRKLLTDMGISVSHAATSEFCDGCALGKAHRKPFKSRPYSRKMKIPIRRIYKAFSVLKQKSMVRICPCKVNYKPR